MRYLQAVLIISGFALSACRDASSPTAPALASLDTVAVPATQSWVDGRYPTEEEFLANGGQTGGLSATNPFAYFSGNNDSFIARSTITWSWVNSLSVTLDLQLKNGQGTTINSDDQTFTHGAWIPFSTGSHVLETSIGTLGNSCGLYGRARVSGQGALYLIKNVLGVSEVWKGSVDQASDEVPQGSCSPPPPPAVGGNGPQESAPTSEGSSPNGHGQSQLCFDVYRAEWGWDYNTQTGSVRYYYDHTVCYQVMEQRLTPTSKVRTEKDRRGAIREAEARQRQTLIVAVDSLPGSAGVAVVHRADPRQPQLVLVDRRIAESAAVAAALAEARNLRENKSARDLTFVPKAGTAATARDLQLAEQLLAELRVAAPVEVPGVGRYPAVRAPIAD